MKFSVRRPRRTDLPPLYKKIKALSLLTRLYLESGDYLSSRRLTASTFGVRKLNFCVRNGNRWILSAIITAMAICLVTLSGNATYTNFISVFTSVYPVFKTNLLFQED